MRMTQVTTLMVLAALPIAVAMWYVAEKSADAADVTVQANVLTKSICRFRTNAGSPVLDFGNLDPVTAPNVTVQTAVEFRCQGSVSPAFYVIGSDDGLHSTGPASPRMQSTLIGTEYLPYSLSLSPSAGSIPLIVWQTLTIEGTVLGADYQTVATGPYLDTVTLFILP